ncbi:DUF397 domain-containing protein [Nonomuraea sp. SYSU D8015]|uniref:DUF397 domain-containing protein n=1 Tax=Nonomuraea sp. SYSU D8015 TaxID=2593644 RepID=UPI001660F697|nr:DUF397 domain-containing protein [Nonomuraea sp. SYSU D8015]
MSNAPAVAPGEWRKSSLSGGAGECVEFAVSAGGEVLVRDSKNPTGPVLTFTKAEWRAFIGGVRNSEFDV